MSNGYAHRPAVYKTANILGRIGEKFGIGSKFDTQQLLKKAQRITNLKDFGDMGFVTGFEVLVHSLNTEAELNTIGKLSTKTYLLQLLCNRLWIEENLKKHPAIAQQAISRPIFITGLPRSGSTLLHALLAQDPSSRAPLTWEVMYPSAAVGSSETRLSKCASNLKWLERLAPKFNSIHAVKAHLPQECIAITTHDFASIQFHTTYNVPSYQRWLEQRDMTPAYHYHKRFLQHLQNDGANENQDCGGRAERWLLKAPGHLFDIAALMQVYPDAQVIQTHRDPLRVVASIASHANVIRAAFSDELHPQEIAKDWQQYWQRALSRGLAYRDDNPEQGISDVYYSDLLKDPVSVVKRLYQELGLPFSSEFESAINRYMNRNPQAKHQYTLQEFGFGPNSIKALFSEYYESHQSLIDV